MFEIDAIDAGYGDSLVLRNVSLSVPDEPAVIALLGPNEHGEDDALTCHVGVARCPRQERVVFAGEDVTHARADRVARRGLCHIPEGAEFFPTLSVRENLVLNAPRGKHNGGDNYRRGDLPSPPRADEAARGETQRWRAADARAHAGVHLQAARSFSSTSRRWVWRP